MTRWWICRNGNTLGYVPFARGGSNFLWRLKASVPPARSAEAFAAFGYIIIALIKTAAPMGQRLQLAAASEVSSLPLQCSPASREVLLEFIDAIWMSSSHCAFTTQQISPQLEMGSGGANVEIRSAPCSPQLGEVLGALPSPALKIKWFGESSGSCREGDDQEQLVIVWLCGVSWCNFCLLCLPWMLFQV